MTRLEQEVLEEARHYIPEIAKQLGRIADTLEVLRGNRTGQAKEK